MTTILRLRRDHLMASNGRGAWAVCHTTGYGIILVSYYAFKDSDRQCQRCLNWLAKQEVTQ